MAKSAKQSVVEEYFKAISSASQSAFEAILAPNFVLTFPQPNLEIPTMSREDAIAFLTTGPGTLLVTEEMKTEIIKSVETEDSFVAEVRVTTSTHAGGQYDNTYVLWYTFADGKIVECREHTDTAYVQSLAA